MGVSFIIITSIEIIQFVTYLGAADIDEVFLNMIGCIIGYVAYPISLALLKLLNQRSGILN